MFVFSTAGAFRERHHTLIKEKLAENGCTVVDEFSCLGQFAGAETQSKLERTISVYWRKNKGHPDEKDLENARVFAKGLLNT